MRTHLVSLNLNKDFCVRYTTFLSKFTPRHIATALQVKPQTVYNYRDGKNAPSPEVIRRAMEAWPGFSLSYRGKVFTLQDFKRKPTLTAKRAVQYELWDAIKKLDSESVQIEILKKESSSVQLGVRIYFRNR